ncbi:YihY/virulence factor BrkB family protein [Tropicimonas sediminicola]|uniref:Membrane protein n=1 Tax=Tropicimonas sediminicola TaxID=1031541 RepID=A0A239L0Q6_9RHOB|nr:YihY/virulence factor BrkB family protein [Tropicimonas sediminicola]SNT23319.1 membrane protein [Tropicimonas sediminicola]
MSRGRDARRPTEMTLPGWRDTAARVGQRFGSLHLPLIAAGVAFYGLLAIFPAISAGVAVLGLVLDPSTLVSQSQWLFEQLPNSAASIISDQVREVAGAASDSLGFAALLSLAIALWSASNATGSLIQGIGLIWEEEDERGFVKTRLLTIGMTLALIAGLGLFIGVVAAIPGFLAIVGAGQGLVDAVMIARWPIGAVIGIAMIAMLYRWGPDRRSAKWRWLTPGSVLACVLWIAGTIGFSHYVQSFASYNETFGTIAGVIILLTWMWLSALIVLSGALLDAELEAQTARDTTVGPDRPMGSRGAVKADTLGEGGDGRGGDRRGALAAG